MTGEQIYAQFRLLCPKLSYEMKSYKRTDPHTIELKSKDNRLYIFTFKSATSFMLKTKEFA